MGRYILFSLLLILLLTAPFVRAEDFGSGKLLGAVEPWNAPAHCLLMRGVGGERSVETVSLHHRFDDRAITGATAENPAESGHRLGLVGTRLPT